MTRSPCPKGLLSGNMLKLIAAAAMLADHVGLMFFPGVEWLRILGRLALPIFAFMIGEGCRYTKDRLRYFLHIFVLAAVCQVIYFIADGSLYMSILVTFSCSILIIFALQEFKAALARSGVGKLLWGGILGMTVAAVYVLNTLLQIDYGFWGCMLPVFPALFQNRHSAQRKLLSALDRHPVHVLSMAVGLLLLSMDLGGYQIWCLMALPLLFLYSGKRGRLRMKYFFYIFYPLHLGLLQLLAWCL